MNNPTLTKFVGKVATTCAENNVSFIFSSNKTVKLPEESDELACSGFFDDVSMTLAVAAGSRGGDWVEILVHEYCHLLQYLEGKYWFKDKETIDLELKFWSWLEGKEELTEEEIDKACRDAVECERDCEIRTLELLRKNRKFGVNTREYLRRANCYLFFYGVIKQKGKWCSAQSPSMILGLQAIVPGNRIISVEEAMEPSDKFVEIAMRECTNEN